jgi:hypothetical protein
MASFLRDAVRETRTAKWKTLRVKVTEALRKAYEAADPDELVFPIIRVGQARANGPGGTYYAGSPDLGVLEGYGHDQVATRARRQARLLAGRCASLPRSWSVRLFERLAWPSEKVREGAEIRLFLEIERGDWKLEIPIHDAISPWRGQAFKARVPGGFPIPPTFPFSGYIVLDDKAPIKTYCQWLTVYLAQRGYLEVAEESSAVEAFFGSSRSDLRAARFAAYERMKRRFVQPPAGRASFSSYFWKASEAARREDAWHDRLEPGDLDSVWIDLKRLRYKEPALHRAVLQRLKKGTVRMVDVHGRPHVHCDEVARVEHERLANAQARSKAAFTPTQRAEWLRRLERTGLSKPAARRKLARWTNELGLDAVDIERVLSAGRVRKRVPSRRRRA